MKLSYTYWQNGDWYLGHLDDYPEYDTQGKTLQELEAMLKDLYRDLTTENLPGIKHKGVLEIA
jgi:predicted RNase H-like HicB family nuclease